MPVCVFAINNFSCIDTPSVSSQTFVSITSVLGLSIKDTTPRTSGQDNMLTPQVAIVTGGVEGFLTSPSPPGW